MEGTSRQADETNLGDCSSLPEVMESATLVIVNNHDEAGL